MKFAGVSSKDALHATQGTGDIARLQHQDKTSLSFNLEPCFQVVPELVNWKSGSYKPLKRWRAVHTV